MDSKQCSKCKEVKALSQFNKRSDRTYAYRSECKKCQYETQYVRIRKNRQKFNAKHLARLATKKGTLQKPMFCERCGEVKPLDRHHPNYKKPLKVEWLCRRCHTNVA